MSCTECNRCRILEEENNRLLKKLSEIRNIVAEYPCEIDSEVDIIEPTGIMVEDMYAGQKRELQLQTDMNMVHNATEMILETKKKISIAAYVASWLAFL